ncbi:MAG: DDE-type integrase/transposase/recombinase [Candidatus Binatus sp.]|uniref:transposase n=1 Tax=Candidatus Binatus sp. TaxID=2811406 RepID=UPI003C77A092
MSRAGNAKRADEAAQLPAEQVAGVPALMDAAALPVVAAPVDPLDGIPRALIARAEAKAEIVAAFRACRGRSCRTLNATGASFVERYNSESEKVSAKTRALYPTIEWPSLQRDWRRFEKSGVAGLVPGYRGGKSIVASNPLMREHIIAQIAHNPKVNAPWLLKGIEVRFPNDRIPDLRSVERFIRDWKRQNASLFLKIEDPAGWRNKHMLAIGETAANVTRVNQLWEIDGSPADCYVLGTESSPGGRLQMLVAIDKVSRRMVALLAPNESSSALAALLCKALPILGVPDAIKHDNGAGFTSERTQRGITRLGIAWPATAAYSGWKKPFIERGQKTILHSFFENVPGFIGHDVKEAAQIRERAGHAPGRGVKRNMRKLYRIEMTAPELQVLLDQWIEHVYGNRKHRGLGGRTPNEVFAEADRAGQVRRVADDRLLDLLLGEDGVAAIGKQGIRVDNAFYWDDAFAEPEHMGKTIQYVRTRNQGKLIVYTADSAPRFIGIAIDQESDGVDREVLAIAAKQNQSAKMSAEVEKLRDVKKKHRPQTLYREIINLAVAKAAAMLPAPAEAGAVALPYRSAALTAAAAALEALDAPAEPTPHSEEVLREGAEALAEMDERRELRELQLSDDELDALWLAIRREPRVLTLREQRFLAHYENTAESWADNFETTPEFEAMMMRRKWLGRENQRAREKKTA